MRTMGLDLGTRTIGVAVSDELGLTAQPVTTLRRRSLSADLSELNRLAHAHQVERWVVGLPLNMNGTEGEKAVQAREFGAVLEKNSGQPVEFWDERLSTRAAERTLLEANISRSKRREVIDRVAAVIILQGWLDSGGGVR
jgi:putative holliday junction resolvase